MVIAGLLFHGCIVARSQQDARLARDHAILSVQDLIAQDKTEDAKRLLDSLSARYPKDAGLDNLRGVLAAQSGNASAAEHYFKEALQFDHQLVSAHLNLGRLYQEESAKDSGVADKALHEYEAVLALEAKNDEANYQAAVLLMRQAHYHESSLHLLRLSATEQMKAQVLSVQLADAAAEHHSVQADTYSAELIAAPELAAEDARQALPGLSQGKRYDIAVQLLTALKDKGPLPDDLHTSLGEAYRQNGAFKEARAVVEELYQRNDTAIAPLLLLAEIAHEQRDYQGALGYLAHAQDLDPKNAGIRYSFGLACLDLDLLGEAQKSFKKAIDLNSDNADYNYALGMTTSYMHEPGEGIPYLQKYMQLRPDDPKAVLALGVVNFRAKEFDTAVPFLKKAATIPSVAPTAHYYLGSIATQQGHPDDAIQELKLAIRDDPKYADALAELGQTYLAQKNYSAAESAFEQALHVDPDHYSANFGLLTVYIRTKDTRRAQQSERFEAVQKLSEQKKQEYLRVIEARPLTDTK